MAEELLKQEDQFLQEAQEYASGVADTVGEADIKSTTLLDDLLSDVEVRPYENKEAHSETLYGEDSPTGKPVILINEDRYPKGSPAYTKMVQGEALHLLKLRRPDLHKDLIKAAIEDPEYMDWQRDSYEIMSGTSPDPRTGKYVDEQYRETRDFNDWHNISRFDQILGGYIFAGDEDLPTMRNWDRGQLRIGNSLRSKLDDFANEFSKGRSNKSSEATISSDDPDSPTPNEGGLMSAEAPQNNRTIVIETDQGWVAVPQINQFGEEYDEESLRAFIKDSGPVDPITQEELPVFEDEEEAQEYAKVTEEGDMPEAESAGRGYDSGSSEARGAMRALDDQEPVGMYHGGMMLGGCGDPLCPSCGDMSVGIDAMSGNPIPPGSNEENVRDDIPAVLSDGEYVVPADVVRYHGLKTFMSLRDEAKFGLMSMYAEGQIQTLEEEYGCEDCDGEDCDCEYEEDTEYETPEENVVEKATPEIEEETMEVEEEEEEYSSDSKNTYRPSVKIAVMKK